MSTLRATGLVKQYRGRNVVNGVDLELSSGSIIGLLGPNGAGKTTTFYMIAGIVAPDGGRVLLDGEEIGKLPLHRRARLGITYLPQEPSVFRGLSVEDNLRLVFEERGLAGGDIDDGLNRLLEEMGLADLRRQKGHSLSGGERRRVEVARALATEPKFVLLDEPFAGVDPISVSELQTIIKGLKSRGIGVFISDHNVRETLTVCDQAYILNKGEVLEYGPPERIAQSEKARKIYLGEQFRF